MPLPKDETTPPVTNTYLAIWFRKLNEASNSFDTRSRSSGVSTPSDS